MDVNYQPQGSHTVVPYLVCNDVDQVIAFLQQALDAILVERMMRPGGGVMHAEVRIGDSLIMMGEPMGGWKPMPGSLYVYVKDADESFRRAIAAGATVLRPPTIEFYGDRCGGVADPAGNHWFFATHIEDVSPAEIERRAQEMMSSKS